MASVNAQDKDGRTALMCAASTGIYYGIVKDKDHSLAIIVIANKESYPITDFHALLVVTRT